VDGAAGNPFPPPTTGFRPGVFKPFVSRGISADEGEVRNFAVASSGSVGSHVGTGTAFVPMYDSAGNPYLVTAAHVTKYSPFTPVENVNPLVAPGRLDGKPVPVGDEPYAVSLIEADRPYAVDAVAFRPNAGVAIDPLVRFGVDSFALDGVARDPQPGDVMIAVGRGRFVGIGQAHELQSEPVPITWQPGVTPQIDGQVIVANGVTRFAVAGFSGGCAIRLRWTPDGLVRELVGMVVAGNDTFTYVTPVGLIEESLGLRVAV
jgi:hypothetical protein